MKVLKNEGAQIAERENERPLRVKEAAAYLSVSVGHLRRLAKSGNIPHYQVNGKLIYFDRAELRSWLMRNRVIATAAAGNSDKRAEKKGGSL